MQIFTLRVREEDSAFANGWKLVNRIRDWASRRRKIGLVEFTHRIRDERNAFAKVRLCKASRSRSEGRVREEGKMVKVILCFANARL